MGGGGAKFSTLSSTRVDQDRNTRRPLVNVVMNPRGPQNAENFLTN
jgi:hypothetical protein